MFSSLCARSSNKFSESNPILQLFKLTGFIFLISSIVTAFKMYFGSPIDCIYDGIPHEKKSFVDLYCWKHYEPVAPQVTPLHVPFSVTNTDLQFFTTNVFYRKQSANYRWLPLMLLFQAALTFTPFFIWNAWKDQRLQKTLSAIKEPHKQSSRRKLLVISLTNDLANEALQSRYSKLFFFCEIFNFFSFLLNLLFTNLMFQHQFLLYGIKEMGMKLGKASYPEIFPTFAECTIQLATKDGRLTKEEAVCMVSFNSLCEIVFLILWFWCLLMLLLSLIGIIYRIFMIVSKKKRKTLLMEAVDKCYEEKLSLICQKLSFYSWFALYRVSRNADPLTCQDIISSLIVRIDNLSIYKTLRSPEVITHADEERGRGKVESINNEHPGNLSTIV